MKIYAIALCAVPIAVASVSVTNAQTAPDSIDAHLIAARNAAGFDFAAEAKAANYTILMSNHSEFDNAVTKIKTMAARQPDEPHPFELGADAVARYFTVTSECARAARLKLLQAVK